jgi:hypothetical protein
MGRRHFYVFNGAAAIPLVVLDSNIRELDMPVVVRQVPLPRPPLDLLGRPIGPTARVAPAAIGCLEKALIVAFQLLFEDDVADARAALRQAFGRLPIGAIEPRVVRQLARLRDTRVVRLTGLATAGPAAILEDLTTAIRERHKGRPRPTDDVRGGADQTLATKVCEVAILHAIIAILLAQIRCWNNPKRSRRRQCSHFGSSQVVVVSADSDVFA